MYRVSYEYVQVCVSIKFSDGVPGGAVEPLCRARVPASGGVLMAAGSNVCANFQEFLTMLSPPKMVKKKENPNEINRALLLSGLGPKKNPYEINRTLRLSGLGPNEKDNITLNNQAS